MAITYCNINSDLRDAYAPIESHRGLEEVTGFETSSGDVYKLDQAGYQETIYENGVKLAASNPATTTPAAGEYSYDEAADILYIRCSDSKAPTTKKIEGGYDWKTLKTRCRADAQEHLESLLAKVFAIPFQKIVAPDQSYSSRNYDTAIRKATAYLTCSFILDKVLPKSSGNELSIADKLYQKVDNPDPDVNELPGIVQRILSGEITLKTQRSAREIGGYNVFEKDGITGTALLEITGRYTGSQKESWRIEIDTLGSPGTSTFKLSRDGGSSFESTLNATRTSGSNNQRVSLGAGLYACFVGASVVGDYWDLQLYPYTDVVSVPQVGSIRMVR